MKINDTLKNTPVPNAATQAAQGAKAEKAAAPTPQATGDSVRLSAQGQALAGAANGEAVFDTKKVERIKNAIAEGQFKVSPEKIADGLLETVRDLLHSRKR